MSEKLLSIVVPVYNMEKYLRRCLGSLVTVGSEAEILVVNDGSADESEKIALDFEALYPDIVRVITKENGGHGSALNTGLSRAKGKYFYTVDGDDWLEVGALGKVIDAMKRVTDGGEDIDLFIVNYRYNQLDENKNHVVHYRNALPQEKPFQWKDTKSFSPFQFISLHSTIHKTSILRETGILLPEHTFYVDNIFVYNTLPAFKNLYYIDANLYQYFIGREDQSVSYKSMINRIDQHVKVIKIMMEAYHLEEIEDKKLRKYMYSYLGAVYAVVNAFLTISEKKENREVKKEVRDFLKNYDKVMYRKLKRSFLSGNSMTLGGKTGYFILGTAYKLGKKIFKYS